MALDDGPIDCEAQAEARDFGGEERLEQPRDPLRRDSWTREVACRR